MTKKDISVKDRLKNLYELQQIDSQLDKIKVLKGELPKEVQDLEDEIIGIETRLSKLEASVKEHETEVLRHQGNIKDSEGLIAKYTKQLDDVKNNREYEALTKEIEMQKLEIQLSNKNITKAQLAVDEKKEQLVQSEEKLNIKKQMLDQKRVELDAIIAKTEKDEEALFKKIEKARKKLDERLLASYDKIRRSLRNGLAIVNIGDDMPDVKTSKGKSETRSAKDEKKAIVACGGCFNQIPPQKKLEISLFKKIIVCEHCGRVLVDRQALEAEDKVEA
jgi:uncharacterized protein